jgi:hypothetical protein
MKYLALFLVAFVLFVVTSSAQSVDCPPDKVCISREAALKAVADGDTVKAQTAEIAAKDKAFADLLAELNKMRAQFAEVSGENTALKQQQVRTDAIIDLLLKNVKPKKIGLINF